MHQTRNLLCFTHIATKEIQAALSGILGASVHFAESKAEFFERVDEADGLIVSGSTYDREVGRWSGEKGTNLQWIQFTSSGVDALVANGGPAGATICNAAPAWGPAVAEHAFALLLGLARGLQRLELVRQQRRWTPHDLVPHLRTLEGRTLVCLGFGEIGRAIAIRAKAFDMRVIGVTRSGAAHPLADQMVEVLRLAEALPDADALVLAVPLTAETVRLVGSRS